MPKPDRKPNRLIEEKSPYLLQHAYNPVDWHAWGSAVFEKAAAEDKPVFLSIGYSTCHWCHVMEEESFENERLAAILNRHFIPVKVDREERPDIDQVYMDAVMAMTGAGGWPLNVFLTPGKKPFFGGTYFPPDDRYGKPGFETVLLHLAGQWETDREHVLNAGESISRALSDYAGEKGKDKKQLTEAVLKAAFDGFRKIFDSENGGFGRAPKFPTPHSLSFLLGYYDRSADPEALGMVRRTLDGMRKGGIHDHLGGGFHRYSTDEKWHVPHFEKMLYDQALLAKAYLEAYQVTGAPEYALTARDIFDYVCRDLRGPQGAFLSAEDADSAPDAANPDVKKEGAFYVWNKDEFTAALEESQKGVMSSFLGVREKGNVEHDPFGEFGGANVLYEAEPIESLARKRQAELAVLETLIRDGKTRLLKVRITRARPHLDDKVLTDWNGLMIAAFAYGGRALALPALTETAEKAAAFILKELMREDMLYHRWREGEAAIQGFLDDYAFFIYGLIELYETTFKPEYLRHARKLAEKMLELFEDAERGGFFFCARNSSELLSNPKHLYDGAVPSGNSVAIGALIKLDRLLGGRHFEAAAVRALDAFSGEIAARPTLYPYALMGLDYLLGPSREIVIAEGVDRAAGLLLRAIQNKFAPRQVVVLRPGDSDRAREIDKLIPFAGQYLPLKGVSAAYVCENYTCREPVTSPAKLDDLLKRTPKGAI